MKKAFWIIALLLVASIVANVWLITREPVKETKTVHDTIWKDTTIYEPKAVDSQETGRVVYIRVPVSVDGGLIGDSPRCSTIVEQAGTVPMARKEGTVPMARPMAQKDSMEVAIPIVQKRYEDSLYTAWVSGFRPNLDSIRLHQREIFTTVTKYVERPAKRLAIGPSIGVGYGIINGKPDIWAGVTVTWNFNK
jgi:hypothetical protein